MLDNKSRFKSPPEDVSGDWLKRFPPDQVERYSIISGEREEKPWDLYQKRFLELIPRGGIILDIGAGFGEDSSFFSRNGLRVISADLDEEKLRKVKRMGARVEKVVMDLRNLAIRKDSLDGIWMANVFIFLDGYKERETTLRQCLDIMKPGAVLFLCDNFFPIGAESSIELSIKPDELSIMIRELFDRVGFEVIEEEIGVGIPEKRGYDYGHGFHVIFAHKPLANLNTQT